ncbi:flocculation protein FLO11 [Melanaphis sacchari]|uniref:flocculation protein FLO11 n=1 Tax=Melanaphis sacchari TaxID=742174 RepID=UPI000DC14B96|nr:flocculation protein FLO11 [Melanaphis sacchari]
MAGTDTRWLAILCLLSAVQCVPSKVTSQLETDSEDSRRVLGSSVVTSVSVIMDHGNGTKTYFADGQSKNVHKPTDTIIGSPGNLLSPDRYEFYTFDETGDLVKRLMTLDEIHGLIAGADPESVMADASPTYYHDALASHSSEALMHLPASDLESLDAPAVHKVLESVQNVLKNEMAANSGKPIPSMPSTSLHRPDSASAWSALFPGLIETPDDVAHLSGYLLPSKTTESMDTPLIKKPFSPNEAPLVSMQPQSTTLKLPSSSIKTQLTTTTEKIRSTPKSTVKPEVTTKFTPTQPTTQWTTLKPLTTKKPFKPIQSFEKQKPALQKPILMLHSTAKPPITADSLEMNKEMSASISDMLSQVTDSQSSNHKPLQTNDLIEKDSTSDYVPEESSPELSYYSPIAMSLSTGGALKPVTEALTSAKKPPTTMTFKTTTTDRPFSQKTAPTITATRFSPPKSNFTKPRPHANATTTSYMTKPSSINKFTATTASTTRNNYQYPPSNMSTKYMQKITQTTQAYPNKLIDSFVKVVNKTVNNATLSVKQPIDTFWNSTEEESKNKFVKEPVKVFQTKVTSSRPNGINRTNVTLSNRIQELKTTAIPNFGYGSSTTTVRSQTEPDKYVSVKVEEWPITVQHPTAYPSTTPYMSTEKSFFSSNSQSLSSVTDPNVIRDLISSFMTKTSTVSSISTSTVSPTTVSAEQTLTAAMSTTTPSVINTVTGIPTSMTSSTVRDLMTSTTTTTTTTTPTTTISTKTEASENTTVETTTKSALTTTGMETVKTAVEAADTGIIAVTTTAASMSAANMIAAGTTVAQITTDTPITQSTASAATDSITSTTATGTTVANVTTVTFTTPESETQYVPVTHFLPELQLKDRPETEINNSAPGVDMMLKDGINAVTSMLQDTQKPAVPTVLETEYQEIGKHPYEKLSSIEGKQSSTEQTSRKQATVKSDFDETTTFTVSENTATQDLYEFTTIAAESVTKFVEQNDSMAAESVTTNETEQILRNSELGLEMLTVFNVSSTDGPGQVAKLTDLASETQALFDTTTPFENRSAVTNLATDTEEPVTTTFPLHVPPVTKEVTASTVTVPSTSTTTTKLPSPIPLVKAATVTPASVTTATAPTTASAAVSVTASESEIQNSTTTVAENSSVAVANYTTLSTPATVTSSPIVKSPGPSSNAYRPPMANSASPSTVELHPAPHESMGMEASVAFLGDDVRRFVDLCNELSFKMWTAVTGKGQIASRSLVLSPFELTAMLAMVFLGARGSTSGQMNDVLRLDDMVTFNPHQVLRNITHSITNVNNPGVATASFVREIYSHKGNGKILEFYKERVQQYYDGHVEEVDFNTIGDVLRRRTNLLVKRQTLGRVVEYLRGSGLSLTPPFAAFSANVFQTSCESASTEGRDGEMYFVVRPSTRQRRLVPVPAAVWRSGFLAGYEPGLDATAVCLGPDSAVSTILVLPGQQGQVAPGDGLARLEQRLIETSYRRGGWSRVLRSLLPRPGLELQVPRFSHRSVLNTTAALQKMGLRDVFSDQKADLRGVNGLYDLYLSDMLQVNTFSTCGEDTIGARHHVETYPASPQRMGRNGRDGSSLTGSDDDDRVSTDESIHDGVHEGGRRKRDADDLPLHSPYSHLPLNLRPRQARLPDVPRLRFDRPFLYLVRHNPTGMIIYLGRFNPRLLP